MFLLLSKEKREKQQGNVGRETIESRQKTTNSRTSTWVGTTNRKLNTS